MCSRSKTGRKRSSRPSTHPTANTSCTSVKRSWGGWQHNEEWMNELRADAGLEPGWSPPGESRRSRGSGIAPGSSVFERPAPVRGMLQRTGAGPPFHCAPRASPHAGVWGGGAAWSDSGRAQVSLKRVYGLRRTIQLEAEHPEVALFLRAIGEYRRQPSLDEQGRREIIDLQVDRLQVPQQPRDHVLVRTGVELQVGQRDRLPDQTRDAFGTGCGPANAAVERTGEDGLDLLSRPSMKCAGRFTPESGSPT